MKLKNRFVVPWRISKSFPEGELWAAVDSAKPVPTKVSPSVCGLFIPHAGLQDVWTVDLKPTPGYCGSWIVDPSAEAVCGIIVAGSESSQISYALPAHAVFDEIQARFPGMKLQSLGSIAVLPTSRFVELIQRAMQCDQRQLAEMLVSNRKGLDDKDFSDWNSLCWATSMGYEATFALLLNKGANPVQIGTPNARMALTLAAELGHLAIVQLLLAAGVDPNSGSGSPSTMPLISAIGRGHHEVVHVLMDRGAMADLRDGDGNTPLTIAAARGDVEIVNTLIKRGADIAAKDGYGLTSLICAVRSGCEEAARVLLVNGADVDCTDNGGKTPLIWAVQFNNPAIVELLLERGANVNSRDRNGDTPLILAAQNHHYAEVVRILLEFGADVDLINDQGDTLLIWAVEFNNPAIVELLLERGTNVNSRDRNGNSPLILAAQNRYGAEVVRTLLKFGADVDLINDQGDTALTRAITKERTSIIEILQDHGATIHKPYLGKPQESSTLNKMDQPLKLYGDTRSPRDPSAEKRISIPLSALPTHLLSETPLQAETSTQGEREQNRKRMKNTEVERDAAGVGGWSPEF